MEPNQLKVKHLSWLRAARSTCWQFWRRRRGPSNLLCHIKFQSYLTKSKTLENSHSPINETLRPSFQKKLSEVRRLSQKLYLGSGESSEEGRESFRFWLEASSATAAAPGSSQQKFLLHFCQYLLPLLNVTFCAYTCTKKSCLTCAWTINGIKN